MGDGTDSADHQFEILPDVILSLPEAAQGIFDMDMCKSSEKVQKYDNMLFAKAGNYYRKCGRSTGEL